jgi:hypothetical protein
MGRFSDVTQREAELSIKLRDAINMIAVQYPDIFDNGMLLGSAIEGYIRMGVSREDVHGLVDHLWHIIEDALKDPASLAEIEAKAGVVKS